MKDINRCDLSLSSLCCFPFCLSSAFVFEFFSFLLIVTIVKLQASFANARVLWHYKRSQDAHNVDSSVSEARDSEGGGEDEEDDEDEEEEEDEEDGEEASLSFPPFVWPSSWV